MKDLILLVEDEENDVFFMKRAMKAAGFPQMPHVASDGQAAIEYLSEAIGGDSKKIPCLVLLDLKLPQVMGLDVLQWIRQQPELQSLIVIILTSSKMNSDVDAAYRYGANSYLVKPGTAPEILAIAKLIKDYWLNANQLPAGCKEAVRELAHR